MVRIIPWNLPPVNGGSIGGYTPKVEPTPEPTPIPYNFPYILDNIVIEDPTIVNESGSWRNTSGKIGSTTFYAWWQTVGNRISVGSSGVEIVDTQNVSSVVAEVNVSGTMVRTYYERAGEGAEPLTKTNADLDVDVQIDITSVMSSVGGSKSTVANVGGTLETLRGSNTSSTNHDPPYTYTGGPVTITTTPTLTLKRIVVYNSNGVALQEWTPPEEEEE